jgi:hypothetical protein
MRTWLSLWYHCNTTVTVVLHHCHTTVPPLLHYCNTITTVTPLLLHCNRPYLLGWAVCAHDFHHERAVLELQPRTVRYCYYCGSSMCVYVCVCFYVFVCAACVCVCVCVCVLCLWLSPWTNCAPTTTWSGNIRTYLPKKKEFTAVLIPFFHSTTTILSHTYKKANNLPLCWYHTSTVQALFSHILTKKPNNLLPCWYHSSTVQPLFSHTHTKMQTIYHCADTIILSLSHYCGTQFTTFLHWQT